VTETGEVIKIGKYNASAESGKVTLEIKNTEVADEATYRCAIGFASSVNYNLEVEGKLSYHSGRSHTSSGYYATIHEIDWMLV